MKPLAVLAAAVMAIAALNPAPARAQVNRTFVSGQNGADSNNCSFNNPCRTFAAALLLTNPKGEIVVLDPADYGTVTIGKAVSIVNDGVGVASITDTVGGTAAITINAGASDVVNLRGLTLTGAGVGNGTQGIVFTSGAALNIQNCVIRGFAQSGISFTPQQSSTLTMLDTIVSNNGGGNLAAAIAIQPHGTSLTVNAYLAWVQVSGNAGNGINVDTSGMFNGSLNVAISDAVATNNPDGVSVGNNGTPGVPLPAVALINVRMTNNATGLFVGNGATAYLAETVISGNSLHGFVNSSGIINTFGNNRITDTTNIGSLTAIAEQ